jgi:glutaredoxin
VKEFLSRNGREFTAKHVDEDPEAFNELVALGFMTIPVTIIGDTVIRGFDEKQLRAALGLPGRP